MDSSNQPQLCRLCLRTIEDVVNIWETFQDSTIATVLAKHFWFQLNKNDGLTEWLCTICWEQTKAFHEFYERVEQFQKSYWESIKSDGGRNDETIVIEPDLTIVKCEETELTVQAIDSQLNEEDDFDYNDDYDDASKTSQTSSDNSQSSDKPSQSDDNRKVSAKRDISSFSQSDKVINQKIREEQNKELNGQIREWFSMKCDICDEDEFDTWYGVKCHYRNVHQTIGYLKCCDQKFHRRCKLLDHIRQHIITPESSKLDAQIREYFSMKCDICPDVPFGTLVDMRRHYRDVHKMHGYLICCGNKFNRRYAIIAHMRCHTNPDEYRCEQCGKSFTTNKALKNHIDNHVPLDSRAFKCDLCTSSFAKAATLRRHVQDKHTSKNGEKFPCEKCKKNYRSELLLKCHIRQTHDTLHNFVCEICARQFKSKQTLQKHVFCEHATTPRPKVQCNICGNWYKNEYGLAKHMTEQHRHTDPVSCPVCNKVCPTKHRLNQHLRTAHAERKHECVLCDKAFRCPKNLKEHVATHTGEDLYKCQYCDKKFKSSANMYSHRKNTHLVEWTRDNEKKAFADKAVVLPKAEKDIYSVEFKRVKKIVSFFIMFDRTVFATMCRLCLTEKAKLVSIHSSEHSNATRSTKKATQITRQIIETFTTVMIQPGDNLPQKICISCVEAVKAMLEFQNKCKQNNEELLKRIMDQRDQDDCEVEVDIKNEMEIKNEIEVKNESDDEISEGIGVDESDSIYVPEEVDEDERETKETVDVSIDDDRDSSSKSDGQVTKKKYPKRKRTSQAKHSKGIKACHICGKLIQNYKFPFHINKHNGLKPFACDIDDCASAFAAPYELQVHKRMIHFKQPEHSCDVCGRAFKRKQALRIHRSYHFDPEIPCKICEKLFKNERALEKHMLVHTMERKFKCETCEKSFQTRYTLRVHKRVHTNEKPYSCHCGMSFAYNCLLKAHTERYHK
ncbi:zinc finger protein 93-like [Bradysia coprophila]|uniref:zinc finger protein 93-like n=1 Tax=Bradysia coprophila TaxID=38358 RepID=UPI00187DA410|nr:zinc finger protein 93-like [Bradysia coprophila]